MNKRLILGLVAAMLLSVGTVMAAKPSNTCVTLQDGTLTYSAGHYLAGQPIPVGYDQYGYNYQAHMFNGYYPNVYLGREGFPPFEGDVEAYLAANSLAASKWYWYPEVTVVMKWNDAWLSNKDCSGDGLLDRPADYIGSGAWETNHQWGSYLGENEETCYWDYFVKIVAKPTAGYECEEHGGREIWGSFCEILSINNDPCGGYKGLDFKADIPGFGYYMP